MATESTRRSASGYLLWRLSEAIDHEIQEVPELETKYLVNLRKNIEDFLPKIRAFAAA